MEIKRCRGGMKPMHLVISLWVVFAAWRWGDWSKIYSYYPTMLYILVFSLQYSVLSHTFDYHLWKMGEEFFPNHLHVDLLYSYIVLPLATFLFLSNYPDEWKRKLLYYAKWIAIFVGLEWAGSHFESITYENDWNLYWSTLFNLITFPMLRFHYRHPFLSWPLSFFIMFVLIWFFEVPFIKDIE